MQYKIFWCKTNKYYTEKWLNTKYLDDKQWFFVASCIVTDKAKVKWLKFVISWIKKLEWEAKIYISWCWTIKKWALVDDFYETYPELLQYKDKIVLLWEDPEKEWLDEKISKFKAKSLYTRKYIIVQNWCDNHCTFCLTIKARWSHKSRNTDDIIREINTFVASWWKEVVITGTNIWAWWTTNTRNPDETEFSWLLSEILEKTKIERVRISSLWIEYINDSLISLLKNPRIYAHLHLSIQSWSDKILKSMNRNYTRSILIDKLKILSEIKRKDWIKLSLWADFIVWFPWEDDSDFEDSLYIIDEFKIAKVHAFPFSAHEKRDSVPAWLFSNQIKENIKQDRMKKIIEAWEITRNNFLIENDWAKMRLLIEKKDWDRFSWWSENYIFLNEKNFHPIEKNEFKIWDVISWFYKYSPLIKETLVDNLMQ